MKFCMNGGLIIGSRDGANLEIEKAIGSENIFLFGSDKFKFYAYIKYVIYTINIINIVTIKAREHITYRYLIKENI
jgi:glucan phosphorylase